MKATQRLHDAGQSLWLDNIIRAPLTSGGLELIDRPGGWHKPQPDPPRRSS